MALDFVIPAEPYVVQTGSLNFVFGGTYEPPPPGLEPPPEYIASASISWDRLQARAQGLRARWDRYQEFELSPRLAYSDGHQVERAPALAWGDRPAADVTAGLPWGDSADPPDRAAAWLWRNLKGRDIQRRIGWDESLLPADGVTALRWHNPPAKDQGIAIVYDEVDLHPAQGDWYETDRPIIDGANVLIEWPAPTLDFRIPAGPYTVQTGALNFVIGDRVDTALTPPVLLSWAPYRAPQLRPRPVDRPVATPWDVPRGTDRATGLAWGPGSPQQRDTGTGWESEPPEPDPSIITVPLLRVYNVSNAITVVRLPERTPIHPLAVSASLDDESWAWRVQMTLFSESEAALLTPAATPKEVEISINGWIIVAAIESYSRDRRYPQQTWTVSGRTRQAYLAEPYQRPRSHVSTGLASAEQLAGDELPSGWTLDWDIPDWTVPAGAWSYDQLTPIQAISRIATAAGAVAQPDPQAKTITVRSRYPASPDDWASATPYASINEGLCTRMGAEYRSNPERNAVIVTGGTQGVLVNATRFGTAGDDPLDTITEALCTAVEAGQERARVELDSTGNAIEQSIAIPVIDPLGVVPPGVLVEVMEGGSAWRGLVRSTSIAVARTDRGISVGQTLGIERRV